MRSNQEKAREGVEAERVTAGLGVVAVMVGAALVASTLDWLAQRP